MNSTSFSAKTYWIVWLSLLVLLFLTWLLAEFDLRPFNLVAALGIAFLKMALIILYFMQVRLAKPVTWIFVGAGFFWLGIMITLALSDYLTR